VRRSLKDQSSKLIHGQKPILLNKAFLAGSFVAGAVAFMVLLNSNPNDLAYSAIITMVAAYLFGVISSVRLISSRRPISVVVSLVALLVQSSVVVFTCWLIGWCPERN
jgi:hypothetical protein